MRSDLSASSPVLTVNVLEVGMSAPFSDLPLVDLLDLLSEQGECQYDPELHTGPDLFAEEPLMERRSRMDAAKAVCEGCPVQEACLEYALRITPTHGVWAGYSPVELAELRKAARNIPALEEVA